MEYADPKRKKYPLATVQDIRNDWRLIHLPTSQANISRAEVEEIKRNIVAAWKRRIDPAGPPSAREHQPPHVGPKSFSSARQEGRA